jgi:hypothetical protein
MEFEGIHSIFNILLSPFIFFVAPPAPGAPFVALGNQMKIGAKKIIYG